MASILARMSLLALLCCGMHPAFGQRTITGTITDEAGDGVIGASVVVQGTATGVVSDFDGTYSIEANTGDVLEFAYLGYLSQTITVGDQSVINVALSPNVQELDQVVVIGYGTVKKSDLTGAVSTVTADDYKDQPVTRMEDALQGRAAGVTVARANGAPGANIKVRIRGVNSITGNNSPLVVVDGIQGADLSSINPNDIASIDVLKDASATAIYGIRGSNGVIMITTKKGRGKGQVDVEFFTAVSQVPDFLPTLQDDPATFARLENLRRINVGGNPNFTDSEISQLESNGGTNYQKEIFQTGVSNNLAISASGSEGKLSYFLSGTYRDQEGILITNTFKQLSLRSNLEAEISDRFTIGLNIFANRDVAKNDIGFAGNGQGSIVAKALTWDPTTPIYDASGAFNFRSIKGIASLNDNPVRTLTESDAQGINEQLSTALNASYKITNNLTYTLTAGTQLNNFNNQIYDVEVGDDFLPHTVFRNNKFQSYQISNILTWQKAFDVHNIKLTGVQEYTNATSITNGYNAFDLSLPKGFFFAELAPNAGQSAINNFSERELSSFMLRAEYIFDQDLLVTATGRYDGTSVFRSDNRWGFFPSVAVAYNLSSVVENSPTFNSLKLRAGWGQVGSQNVGPYSTFGGLGFNSFAFDFSSASAGSVLTSFENADLTWETTSQFNIGVDLGILEGRGSVSLDFFDKTTSDLLLAVPVPNTFGGGIINQNVGEVKNTGIDFSLGYTIVNTENFDWDANLNFSYVKNEVTKLYNDLEMIQGLYTSPGGQSRVLNTIELGQPLGQFQGAIFQGTWKTAEAAQAAEFGKNPGDVKYARDANGEIIFETIGNGTPTTVWGFNNSFSYKGFDVNLFLQGMHGFDVYNIQQAMITGGAGDSRSFLASDQVNQWTPQNETDIPATVQFYNSSRYVEKGDFIRLSNLTLGYNFGGLGERGPTLKAYASGQNLFLITDYTGYDPELSSRKGGQGNEDVAPGINIGAYPNPRVFTFGLRFGF
ncbi:MAG: TonB-dependent receptor [Saprospiraceae bacterium]|nr:TonB-dependent receptor [Saprospiraceae bacterium]